MVEDQVLEQAAKWFKKLDDPAAATFRIAHARHDNTAAQFKPRLILEQYRKTSKIRMERLAAATKAFPGALNDEDESS